VELKKQAAGAAEFARQAAADAAVAAASAAEFAGKSVGDAASDAAVAAASAAEFAGKKVGDAADAAADAATDCYETVVPQVLAAAGGAKAYYDEHARETVRTYSTQATQMAGVLHREFTDLFDDAGAGDEEDVSAGVNGKDGGNTEASPRKSLRDCPYTSVSTLKAAFNLQAAEVLGSATCSALNDRVGKMYEELFASGAASCDGIYNLLDDFNGELPQRKVALCVDDV
jgi:hypothetical protein